MTDMVEEYRTIVTGAGWSDRAPRGRIRFAGPDAASFLQALLTNDVLALRAGQGCYAAYLTPQGRMIADLDVLHRGAWLLGSVPDTLGPALAARFDQLIFSEDVAVSDLSESWTEIMVAGGGAAAPVADALAVDARELDALPELAQVDWRGGFVARGGDALLPMFRIFMAASERDELLSALDRRGVRAMSAGLVEALRVDAGRPLWGRELTTETIPLEAGLLDRAISTSKGCYVGQEIIIRILHRGGGRVARRLMTVVFDPGLHDIPSAGTALLDGGQAVGQVTTAVHSPARGRVIALAYLHRDAAEPGRVVALDGTGTRATVIG